MKAIICNEFAPLDQLEYGDMPDPQARPGTWGHWLAYEVGLVIVARKE